MICSLCPMHLSDGSKQGQSTNQHSPLLATAQVQHHSYLWLSTSPLYFTFRSRPQPHPLLLCNMLCAHPLKGGWGNQRMQPLIQTRKTEDTGLKRAFHPACVKDPFPFENFGLATWFTAIKARNLFSSLTPPSKRR